ncbi:MAG: hypothetical protein ACOYT8_04085 [Candidatus Dependentiae bacterium]
MEFAIIERIGKQSYFSGPNNSYYLMFLSKVFTDDLVNRVIERLSKADFRGFAGNITTVRPGTNNDKVEIGDVYWYEYDTEPIEIDKQELLRVAKEGLSLMEKDVAYIVLTRKDEKAPITITDQLPQGMELYTEHKQLKYRFKNEK